MIETVTSVLRELGLVESDRPLRYNVQLTVGIGVTYILEALVDRATFFHVKASESENLLPVFRAQEHAAQTFCDFVPRPIGHRSRDGWEVAVSEGVFFRRVRPDAFVSRGTKPFQGVIGFFSRQHDKAQIHDSAHPHGAMLAELREEFAGTKLSQVVEPWLMSPGREQIERLPHVWQHGDFARANIGETDSGLVVFDWEDYGKITLPGFDLCTLVASFIGIDPDRLKALRTGDSGADFSAMVDSACGVMRLDPGLFRRLMPLYLLLFLRLKARYGHAAQTNTLALINSLTG